MMQAANAAAASKVFIVPGALESMPSQGKPRRALTKAYWDLVLQLAGRSRCLQQPGVSYMWWLKQISAASSTLRGSKPAAAIHARMYSGSFFFSIAFSLHSAIA
jgi:hypothetical protein